MRFHRGGGRGSRSMGRGYGSHLRGGRSRRRSRGAGRGFPARRGARRLRIGFRM